MICSCATYRHVRHPVEREGVMLAQREEGDGPFDHLADRAIGSSAALGREGGQQLADRPRSRWSPRTSLARTDAACSGCPRSGGPCRTPRTSPRRRPRIDRHCSSVTSRGRTRSHEVVSSGSLIAQRSGTSAGLAVEPCPSGVSRSVLHPRPPPRSVGSVSSTHRTVPPGVWLRASVRRLCPRRTRRTKSGPSAHRIQPAPTHRSHPGRRVLVRSALPRTTRHGNRRRDRAPTSECVLGLVTEVRGGCLDLREPGRE